MGVLFAKLTEPAALCDIIGFLQLFVFVNMKPTTAQKTIFPLLDVEIETLIETQIQDDASEM